jgi:ethanolamine ammonia-lyase small subunit
MTDEQTEDEAPSAIESKRNAEVDVPAWLLSLKESTPARILVGRAGQAFRTQTHLELKADHAAARDAVMAEFELVRDLGPDLVERFKLFEVQTRIDSKQQYLVRPDLGRRLSDAAARTLKDHCEPHTDIQFVLGDGLSATALAKQGPKLLARLMDAAREKGWRVGQTFAVRYCRVGVLNDVGEILDPAVVVLLIGERPGMATAESLSAYLAYRPRAHHNDAHRNLISNIHARGVSIDEACTRVIALAEQMMTKKLSGVEVKENLSTISIGPSQARLSGSNP